MSISFIDNFYGTDWERYSSIVGKFSPIALSIISVTSIFLGYGVLHSLYILIVALVIAVVELQIFSCFSQIDNFRNKVYETLHLESNINKAISFGFLSVFCYFGHHSFNILAGIYLDITSLLYIFAWLNVRHDQENAPIISNSFGTF
jgi:hypothetical protein